MYTSVQYPDTIEPQVQFIEETAPEDIVEKTIEKLHAGVSIKEMCTASALAVVRSSEMPFFVNGQWGHHGGHMHPVSGIHAVKEISSRLSGDNRFLPWCKMSLCPISISIIPRWVPMCCQHSSR